MMAHSQYTLYTSGAVYITHMSLQAFYAIASTTMDWQPENISIFRDCSFYLTIPWCNSGLEVTKPWDSSKSISRTSRRFGKNIGRLQNFDQSQSAIVKGHSVPNMSYNLSVLF